MKTRNLCWLVATVAVAGASPAYADDDDFDGDDDDDALASGVGIGVAVGGGVAGFTDDSLREASSSAGATWEVRFAFGTHIPIGIEAAYIGTSTELGDMDGGSLMGTIVEGAARFNLAPSERWNPFLFVGAGWQRFDARNNALRPAASRVADEDNVLVFPMGLGLSYRDPSGLTVDARGTFRAAADSELFADDPMAEDVDFAEVHTWQASANVGYEF